MCSLVSRNILIMWRLSSTTPWPPWLSTMITFTSVIACTNISETTSFITSATGTGLIVITTWWSYSSSTWTKLRIWRSHFPLTHLIVLIFSSTISLVMATDTTNRSAKQWRIVCIRATHCALLIIVAAKESIFLWIMSLGWLFGWNMIWMFNSSIIQFTIMIGKLLLLFYDSFLGLVIELHEKTLCIVWSKLLPNKETFASI